jgi:apolipoprotein N-acyltransferase
LGQDEAKGLRTGKGRWADQRADPLSFGYRTQGRTLPDRACVVSKMKRLKTSRADHQRALAVFLLCAATAGLYGLAAPKTNIHWLCWVLLVPLLAAWERTDLSTGCYAGWLCGTLVHLVCFPWVVGTIERYSNLQSPWSLLAWILFSLYSGLSFAALGFVYLFLTRRSSVPRVLALPVAYTTMEFLFPFIFPWHLGAGLYRVPLCIQIADLFGVYGITALVVTVNGAFFDTALRWRQKKPIPFLSSAVALLLVLSALAYGQWRLSWVQARQQAAPALKVGLVQANVQIEERRTRLLQEDIWRRYLELSREAVREGAELVVWPESAVAFPYRPDSGPQSSSAYVRYLVRSIGVPVLFGSVSVEADGARNTAYLLDRGGETLGRYDKVHLLAFGEYLPFSDWFPQLKGLVQGVGDFRPGNKREPLCWNGSCFGVLICYEAILKSLPRELVRKGAGFLVNITNDIWFGDTSCPEQHLMLAVFRAVENRVWMVRAANTGISAFIDPAGRIWGRTPLFTQAVRVAQVQKLSLPGLYKDWGNWFPLTCSFLAGSLMLFGLVRHRPFDTGQKAPSSSD